MAARTSWEGFLQLSLISIPVKAYNAALAGQGEIHFHQIHKECGSRIKYKKVCPIHGEVTKDDIVSGYEYQKNEHVILDPKEIEKVHAKQDEAITIDMFVSPDKVEPIHLSGKTFYLVPDGPAGRKSYGLLLRVMQEKNRHAIAGIVLSGHEQRVLIRPMEDILVMTMLYLDNQIKKPSEFSEKHSAAKVSAQELKLAGSLVDASTTEEVDFSEYEDQYTKRMQEVIDAKLGGKQVESVPESKHLPIVNLMDALKKSLNKVGIVKPKTTKRTTHAHTNKAG